MNPNSKTIGIIGGAGPMAGALLLKHIIQICQEKYGCKDDSDFPKVILLSIPFAEMLKSGSDVQNEKVIASQLKEALDSLLKFPVDCLGIACNTLHGFIKDRADYPMFVDVSLLTKDRIAKEMMFKPLLLTTSTAVLNKTHNFRQVIYPRADSQKELDEIIDSILEGELSSLVKSKFENIIQLYTQETPQIDGVILGCTELSVLVGEKGMMKVSNRKLIDPLRILAEELCEIAFDRDRADVEL